MSWASKRKTLIIILLSLVGLTLVALATFAVIYDAPSCSDSKMNDDERGVDCGGSACTYLCTADVEGVSVRFVRILTPQAGRTDVIAYIDNRDRTAAVKGARAVLELYGADQALLGTKSLIVDIPEGATVPLYVPDVYRGPGTVVQAFLTLDDASLKWFTPSKDYEVPTVRTVEIAESELPRIRATLYNDSAFPVYDVAPVATVFDAEGNAIAASKSVVTYLGGQSSATVLFTWNTPFVTAPARVEVLPVVQLVGP